MNEMKCCAVFGCSPMRSPWGFDEEDPGCREMKLEMLQQILAQRQTGATRFVVACGYGAGLYAGEMIQVLREKDTDLELVSVIPWEEQANKWAPYLRERYFDLLAACSRVEMISPRETETCRREALEHCVQEADVVLAVCDPAEESLAGEAVRYASELGREVILIHPVSGEVTLKK